MWKAESILNDEVRLAAEEFGKALAANPAVSEYLRVREETEADANALRLKGELQSTYDDLLERQAAGEMISRGEIEAYYDMEQRVRSHQLLSRHDSSLERLRDVFSEANQLLSARLGLNIKDLVE
jgi:cell fate (sporulation/competence/biofilm development) regulator YlbF (YheA/YmcA/DUF963 family)